MDEEILEQLKYINRNLSQISMLLAALVMEDQRATFDEDNKLCLISKR